MPNLRPDPARARPTLSGALRVAVACGLLGATAAARAPARVTPADPPLAAAPIARAATAMPLAGHALLGPLASLVRTAGHEAAADAAGRRGRDRARHASGRQTVGALGEEPTNPAFAGALPAYDDTWTVHDDTRLDAHVTDAPAAWVDARDGDLDRWSWSADPTADPRPSLAFGHVGAAPPAITPPGAVALFGTRATATTPSQVEPGGDVRQSARPTTITRVAWRPLDLRNPARVRAPWSRALSDDVDGRADLAGDEHAPSVNAETRETMTWTGPGVLAPFLLGRRQGEDAHGSAFGRSIEGAAGVCLRPLDFVEWRLQIAQEFTNQLDVPTRAPALSVAVHLSF